MTESLESKYPFLAAMHPAHLEYLTTTPLYSPELFISILDRIDSEKRDKIMWSSYRALVESMNRMGFSDSEHSYRNFKDICLKLETGIGTLIVGGIIQMTLHLFLGISDPKGVDETKSRVVGLTETVMSEANSESDEEFVAWLVDHVENLPETVMENRKYYLYFCQNVLRPLMDSNTI